MGLLYRLKIRWHKASTRARKRIWRKKWDEASDEERTIMERLGLKPTSK